MNNVVIIENGQQINVNLIAYFNNNNVNYIFYTKNETVQDGLIKMYVAKENNGTNISDEEWNNLKKIMQGIIMSNASVNYNKYINPITISESRAIALKNENITSINNSYNSNTSTEVESGGTNKDLLNQSFAAETPTQTPVDSTVQNDTSIPVIDQPIDNSVQEPVSPMINPIPDVQNNLNMEATPVNLDMSAPIVNDNTPDIITPFDPTNNIEPIVPGMSQVNNIPNEPLTINNITPAESTPSNSINMENSFKVTDEPNIFDQVDNSVSVNHETNESLSNPFNSNIYESNDSNNNIDNNELIELNERKIKLFEELANIYREENKLLNSSNGDLEKTASDLFNNNGTLNENKVLDVNN